MPNQQRHDRYAQYYQPCKVGRTDRNIQDYHYDQLKSNIENLRQGVSRAIFKDAYLSHDSNLFQYL